MASPESLIHLPLKLLNERSDFRDGETNKDSGWLCAINDLPLVNSWLVVMSTLSLSYASYSSVSFPLHLSSHFHY